MTRPIAYLWLFTILPFATLPWVTIAQPQPQPWYLSHATFHLVYLPLTLAAAVTAMLIARRTASISVRLMAWAVALAQGAGFGGHLGELVSVANNGGFDAGEEIFDESLHSFASAITVPSLMLGMALVLAITGVLVVQRRRVRKDADLVLPSDARFKAREDSTRS